ncbi:MAG: tRNA (adenosine(37)-N6)-threonylcarbamoyltransferase complex dimerization subunit type 1 TsaB [Bacteroidetes bacterium]|nr:MAG: tRNA (adenosine(37)-N6)-threonylcarbamoyltransferase complex dimerization subunit type 1 TsaB [Bacteroidota bacterium]
MSLLLHIDTAVENASVCISKNGELIGIAENKNQKDHAAWIQPAIQSLVKKTGYSLKELNAIAVSNGPGSYTGLRVGLATAKGLCYALNKPLITLSTLEVMTIASLNIPISNINYYCPLIDARRMEVFTAIYDKSLKAILLPHARIIDENSFAEQLAGNSILFFGNGAAKCKPVIQSANALFETIEHNASEMIGLAEKKMATNDFADLAYAEPFYIKDFHTVQPKK